MEYLTAKWVPPVLAALAELGVADELAEKPCAVEDLAERVGAQPRPLYRLLRAAASVGVFRENADGHFELTETAELLRADVPGSLRSAAMMFGLEPFWSPYAQIVHTARTGEPAFDRIYGKSIYQYLQENPGEAQIFGAAAAGFHGQALAPIVASYDFSKYGEVVDVGGGSGGLLVELLKAYPEMRGVLFELPEVLPAADEVFIANGLQGRVELVAGDFFAEVPPADAYLIKSCVHNFDDERAIELLRVLRRGGAPVLLVETMIPAGNEPHYSKFDDVEMMVIAGGNDRTEVEWAALVAAAGFRPSRVVRCDDRFSLLEAIPA
ncbi:methyltransferase [Streptomyces sp. SID13031]|uniref:methyltransferase n=1 Tax=Streptomyces sp. SID13031 TaxID=2706046 RepID=UPI0013CAA435|nr:methyltransferase [Streptomyces sp. SID13031]NEA31362.1 SAM-dependent methyltransferase [Streptomyces sp. SID13031]